MVAARLHKITETISTLTLKILVVLILAVNFGQILSLVESGAVWAAAIFAILSFAVGYLTGGPGLDTRKTLAIGTGGRNMSISLVIASQAFNDPTVTAMITVTTVITVCLLLPTCYWR